MGKANKPTLYAQNPVYVVYALCALALFLFCAMLASRSSIGNLEQTVFDLFYNRTDVLAPIFRTITLLGTIGFAIVCSLGFLLYRRRDIAIRVFVSASSAYVLAMLLKSWVARARPEFLLDYVVPRDSATGSGFPSGHTATATALGLTLALYTPRRWRPWIITGIVLVGVSRIYLGVHLPVDVIGGYAIGLFTYSLTNLLLGSVYRPINLKHMVKKMQSQGLTGLKLKPASVDARGSVPFFGEYDGGKVFVKVFNQDNNIADWLFKLTRRIRYRRMEDEVPSFTPKRTIEHEAYVTMLAKAVAGVRVPDLLGVYKIKQNNYAMASMRIDGTSLDSLPDDQLTDALMNKIWESINQLHSHHIIHKDLRLANVFVEAKTKLPWMIDFGFSESSVDARQSIKDNVEFIASSATKIGAKRAVAAAKRAVGPKAMAASLPYMQYAALSGATTTELKRQRGLLEEVRAQMLIASGAHATEFKEARISRISKNTIFQIGVILLLVALLAPQVSSLKESLTVLRTTDLLVYISALVLSIFTYFWATLSYQVLSDIPLKTSRLFLVQWAGSFANRLLPAGLGSMSFNALYMKKQGHNHGESGTIVVLNNLLGLVSSALLITLTLILWSNTYNPLDSVDITTTKVLIILGIIASVVAIAYLVYSRVESIRKQLRVWFAESRAAFRTYGNKPFTVLGALLMQMFITITYTAIMWVCAYAIHADVSLAQSLFAVTMGTLFGSLIPTPGGIGGAEAGIVAAFSIVGLPVEVAIAVAVLYRLATFWLTIPPGYAAYRYTFAKGYFS